ncbi:hypothetical protein ABK040_008206 [Willaertia magna]
MNYQRFPSILKTLIIVILLSVLIFFIFHINQRLHSTAERETNVLMEDNGDIQSNSENNDLNDVTKNKLENITAKIKVTKEEPYNQLSEVVLIPTGETISREDALKIQHSQCQGTSSSYVHPIAPKNIIEADKNWPLFSPSKQDIDMETDLSTWIIKNSEEWYDFCSTPYSKELDEKKIRMNKLGFTINGKKYPTLPFHLPIWIRAYKRTTPLDISLRAICNIDDIEKTILIVTIDGDGFKDIINLLQKVTCVKIRVFFHPFWHNIRQLGIEHIPPTTARTLNTHYVYGMYLGLHIMNYPYVITIEDDLEATVDFYRYHLSMYEWIYNRSDADIDRSKVFAICTFAHGPIHDCNYITPKLMNEGLCQVKDVDTLLKEPYFGSWGSGIHKSSFWEYWSVWKDNLNRVYDGVLWGLRNYGSRFCITPCSPRVRLIPNQGTHGTAEKKWDRFLSSLARWNTPPIKRKYKFLN